MITEVLVTRHAHRRKKTTTTLQIHTSYNSNSIFAQWNVTCIVVQVAIVMHLPNVCACTLEQSPDLDTS